MGWIHEADVDEYENAEEYDYNEALPYAENVIASRRRKFDNIDGEYFDAIVTLSKRVDCPRCPAKKAKSVWALLWLRQDTERLVIRFDCEIWRFLR